jgi:hypothetical protein
MAHTVRPKTPTPEESFAASRMSSKGGLRGKVRAHSVKA